MVATRVPSPRALARVLVAFAVLAGLFLMHGLPASSCGAPSLSDSSMTSESMADHSSSAVPASVGAPVGAVRAASSMPAQVPASAAFLPIGSGEAGG